MNRANQLVTAGLALGIMGVLVGCTPSGDVNSTATSVALSMGHVSKSADTATLHNTIATPSPFSTVTYFVNGQAVMTGKEVEDSKSGITYLPLSDVQDLLLPTLHVESKESQGSFDLIGSWESNPFNVLPHREGTVNKHVIALEVNQHPYVIAKSLTRSVHGKQVTYISAEDLTLFLQRALNVHASWHTNQLSLQIGHTMFSYQGYIAVKPGDSVPSYDSGQVVMAAFPDTTMQPEHSPWRATALGVSSAYTWNIVPSGYGWYWSKGLVQQKHIQSTNTEILDSYNGIRVEYKLVNKYPATNHLPAIAIVHLTVGQTEYRIQLYRPTFTYAWSIYNEVQYTPSMSS